MQTYHHIRHIGYVPIVERLVAIVVTLETFHLLSGWLKSSAFHVRRVRET